MSIWIFLIIGFVFLLIILSSKSNKNKRLGNPATGNSREDPKESKPVIHPGALGAKRFQPLIPKGFQIYWEGAVAGTHFNKSAVQEFALGKAQHLILERDAENPHDENAIKVLGVSSRGRKSIGFIPKEIAEQIVKSNLFDSVKARLRSIYIANNDYVEVGFQITGPKDKKKSFENYELNKPATVYQKEFLRFFDEKLPKGLTKGEAEAVILEIKGNDEKKVLVDEWDAYQEVVSEFQDKDFREGFDIKAVPKGVLRGSLNELLSKGMTYENILEDIDLLIEDIVTKRPDLMRK